MRSGLRVVLRGVAAAAALLVAAGITAVVPDAAYANTVRDLSWHLDALRIPEAHKVSKGRGIVVAVIDSGVDASHPALNGRVLRGHGIGADATPDGRQDNGDGHGTGIAGIIAGIGGDDMTVLGIAPEAKILPISTGKEARSSEVAAGIRWAVDNGADVINVSLGGSGTNAEEAEAVRYALHNDVVVVAAVGNVSAGDRAVASTARVPGAIAVAGTDKSGEWLPDSVRGPEVVLAAPAEKIMAPDPFTPNRHALATGTSASTAIVSGVVALVRAKFPDLDAANVINRLIATVQDKGPAGRDDRYGFGVVDPVAALTASVPSVTVNPLLPADQAPGSDARGADPDRATGPDEGRAERERPAVEFELNRNPVIWVVAVGGLVLLVAVVVALLVVGRRRTRRPTGPPTPYGSPMAPPGHWQPHPPGQQPPHPGPYAGPGGQAPSPPTDRRDLG